MRIPGKMASEVLRHSLMTPATCNYPLDKPEMPARFRGKIVFKGENCIGCQICVRDCPAQAISINKVAEKVFEAEIRLDRCIYCAQCVDSCPRGALVSTGEYELAQTDKEKFKVLFHGKPAEEAPNTA